MIEISSYARCNPMLLLAILLLVSPLSNIAAVTAGHDTKAFILNLKSITTVSHLLHSFCKCAHVKCALKCTEDCLINGF